MSIIRSVDATMKNFKMSIDGKPILLDHVKQLNVYSGIGKVGCPGDVTITYDMLKMITEYGIEYNPVGSKIEFEIEDNKTNIRRFDKMIITSFRKINNIKSSLVTMTFEKQQYVYMGRQRWWKCFKDKTIVEMFKEFLEEHQIPLHIWDESLLNKRGTWWEYFAVPQNIPTLEFFLAELAKDNLLVYHNHETGGVNLASWSDLRHLDKLNAIHPDHCVDNNVLAKFDESKDQWKESTFVYGKQIDTRAPWKIMEWQSAVAPNIWGSSIHDCIHYSSLKRPLLFRSDDKEVEPNDINIPEETEDYSGDELINVKIEPEPSYEALLPWSQAGGGDPPGDFKTVSNLNIYPRYMFYRMRESYAQHIKWIKSNMLIAGSCKAMMPLTTFMVSYFENSMNENKDKLTQKDIWQSGLYVVTACQLIISGNNILCKYDIQKPFGAGGRYGEVGDSALFGTIGV